MLSTSHASIVGYALKLMVMRIQWATALNAIGRVMLCFSMLVSRRCGLLLETSSIV
jgi:hypothetical protein